MPGCDQCTKVGSAASPTLRRNGFVQESGLEGRGAGCTWGRAASVQWGCKVAGTGLEGPATARCRAGMRGQAEHRAGSWRSEGQGRDWPAGPHWTAVGSWPLPHCEWTLPSSQGGWSSALPVGRRAVWPLCPAPSTGPGPCSRSSLQGEAGPLDSSSPCPPPLSPPCCPAAWPWESSAAPSCAGCPGLTTPEQGSQGCDWEERC